MIPIVFDLDGTLIDSLSDLTRAANAVLAEAGHGALSPEVVARFVGWGEQVFIDRLIAHAALDPAQRERHLERFIEHSKRAGEMTQLMPGVAAALRDLSERSVPMGICTNKPRAPLLPVLQSSGLQEWMQVIVAGDDLPQRKPDPEPLLHAFRGLGPAPGLYVGDSMIDSRTARAAGIPFALFTAGIRTDPIESIPHDHLFADFSELPYIHAGLR